MDEAVVEAGQQCDTCVTLFDACIVICDTLLRGWDGRIVVGGD